MHSDGEPRPFEGRLFIFGGGHCAVPLARVAVMTGFEYYVIEDRPEYAGRDRFPDAKEIYVENMDKVASSLDLSSQDFVAVVTRGYKFDVAILSRILRKPLRYIGLIASVPKRKKIFAQLRDKGIDHKVIETIHAPIGLQIGAETPEEIAVSILAELIKVKNS